MSLASLPTFVEGRHAGGFLVSEARGFRSRDVATLTNSSAAAITYAPGLIVAITTPQTGVTPAVIGPYTSTTAAGTPAAILYGAATIAAGATQKVTLVQRDAEVNAAELYYDTSITTAAQQATILTQLRATNLVAR